MFEYSFIKDILRIVLNIKHYCVLQEIIIQMIIHCLELSIIIYVFYYIM